jgi:hypothetical protein
MGMGGQGTGPGGQHTQDPDEPADIMRVPSKLHARLGCGAEDDSVEVLLMTSDHLPQRMGRGQDQVTGGDREARLPPFCQPCLGIHTTALRTAAVAAGMVDIILLATVITLEQVPSQDLRPTGEPILYRAPRAGA